MYRSIDLIKTGKRIKEQVMEAGYDVKGLQEYLELSCPQSIYRWFQGRILPSVEHLSALSQLLGVHMEDLLVLRSIRVECAYEWVQYNSLVTFTRLIMYNNSIGLSVQ